MANEQVYTDLLNRRELQKLEDLATTALARNGDPLSALMVVHARIRQGRFESALPALYELERADSSHGSFVRDIASMCERETEQLAWDTDESVRERVADMDLWSGREVSRAVRGQATLTTGANLQFGDICDANDSVGRRLLVFGLDRTWRVPFEAIASFELAPQRAFFFDDIWVPAHIVMRPGEPIQQIQARVPSFYAGSLNHENPEIATGRKTVFEGPRGLRRALGQRDYQVSRSGDPEDAFVGIHQLTKIAFD